MLRLGCILVGFLFTAAIARAQDDIEHLAERDWQIPITLSEPIRKEAQTLTLYVSTDLGRTWKKEATAKPSDEFFKYVAPGDGVYWFSVSIVNKAGVNIPAKEADLQPQLKIIVDTKRPEVKLAALERSGENITVSWNIKDEYLDVASLTLQYRAKGDNAWKAATLSAEANGKKQFATGSMAAVEVRVLAKDKAGNQGEDRLEVAATTIVSANQVSPTGLSSSQPPSSSSAVPMLPPAPPLGNASSFGPPSLTIPNAPPKSDGTLPAPVLNTTPPAIGTSPATTPAANNAATNTPGTGMKTFDSGFRPLPPANQNQPSTSGAFQRGVTWTNSQHLDLDFEVTKGPSGVGVMELYYTLDAGKTWQLLDKREDDSKPFSVDVPGEGIYGFTMVVKNKAGLGRAAPQSGELPAVRIGVDVTAPVCELATSVEPVPGRKDLINLRWNAMDANLASGPVKLEWCETPNGAWQEIARNLPNTGVFQWKVPSSTPHKVYMKIEVVDVAGNEGKFITPEPVLIDLQIPEVKGIRLVVPKK